MQPVSVVAWDLHKGFFNVHTTQQVLPLRFRRTHDQHPTFIQAQNNCILFMLSSGEAGALLEESGSLEVRHKSENLCSKDKN